MRRRALVLLLASAAALAAAGAASADSGGLLPPTPESPNADAVRDVYVVGLVVAALVFAALVGALVTFVARRGTRTPEPAPAAEPRSGLLAFAGAAVVLAVLLGFTAYKLPDILDAPAADAAGETRIVVEAHQFYWLFRYPNNVVSINEMVAPAETVVHLEVTAPATDVVHSWWVPQLGAKVDAAPGRTNETWFKANGGTYTARCAELCGLQHAVMDGSVRVVPHERYVEFLNTGIEEAALGKQEFEGVCLTCHKLDQTFIGPPLAGATALSDRDQLERIVREGVRTMPAVGSTWSDDQIDALYAHTRELEADAGEG